VTGKRPGIVVVSPHLDDALLSCYTTLRGRRALVVNVCAGVPVPGSLGAWDRATEATDSGVRMRERIAEDANVLEALGTSWESLDFLEAQYRDGPLDALMVSAALDAAIPSGMPMLAPAGIGDHPDHLQVRAAAVALARRRCIALYLYADLPYSIRAGDGTAVGASDLRPPTAPGSAKGGPGRPLAGAPEVMTLTESAREHKLALAGRYRSQLRGAGADLFHWLRSPHGVAWEAFWPAGPVASPLTAGAGQIASGALTSASASEPPRMARS
jgi:LmbE family N-acetylglucosaminyl deacetylase